jgi:hypothetical protein
MSTEIPDLVDVHFRPKRALGNLVITFALAEAALLDLVATMIDQDEAAAVALLKAQDTKERVLVLASSIGLTGFDLDELLKAIESFWTDKKNAIGSFMIIGIPACGNPAPSTLKA